MEESEEISQAVGKQLGHPVVLPSGHALLVEKAWNSLGNPEVQKVSSQSEAPTDLSDDFSSLLSLRES